MLNYIAMSLGLSYLSCLLHRNLDALSEGQMATPRVFVSSTCYDLQEVRFQVRQFISDFGYEPVMSEFSDIFYDAKAHVQDACKQEVSKCHLFVLVIGNAYGSLYHKQDGSAAVPDSVTLQEFKKAIEVGVPKFIFVNRFVRHDHGNYSRALSKFVAGYFSKNDVPNDQIREVHGRLKKEFDDSYPFPQDQYRYVFYFLDILSSLERDNAVVGFETFDDIREHLRKQWAGLVYEALVRAATVSVGELASIDKRLERIENQIKAFAQSGTDAFNGMRTIDLTKLASEIDLESLKATQEKIESLLRSILIHDYETEFGEPTFENRIQFNQRFTSQNVKDWLGGLLAVLTSYKWSKTIPITELGWPVKYGFWKDHGDVPYEALFELHAISSRLSDVDRESLVVTIMRQFNQRYVAPKPQVSGDDIPF